MNANFNFEYHEQTYINIIVTAAPRKKITRSYFNSLILLLT